MTHFILMAMLSFSVLMAVPARDADEPQCAQDYAGRHPVTGARLNLTFDQHQVPTLRVCARITWHFGISSSHHLRPLLNREILNVDQATPAVSLNRSRPNLVQI